MAFERPITIAESVENINKGKYLLPAIQRDLVWDPEQIERLFDSLMRDYPIGSFLFWYVERDRSKDYQFYDFIRDYHERDNKHIKKTEVYGQNDITAILDGQQRLTSLYIGLMGSYSKKLPRKYWKNDSAFPKKRLYLNLLKSSDKMDVEYDFRFLTPKQASVIDENQYWFRVGKILDFQKPNEVNNFLFEKGIMQNDPENAEHASDTLFDLHHVIKEKDIINYYLEKSAELDKVLNIFIRVNSGGTPLSYSDLLLSIATTQWKEKDAREEITGFVDDINTIRDGFNFNNDFVLKSCLVLSDFKNIAFKVDNFKKNNMLTIEQKWDSIKNSLRLAIQLISTFGFNSNLLVANNAVIPIAYYIMKNDISESFLLRRKYSEDREKIHKWLNICLLKRTFGFQSDTVLRDMREVLNNNYSSFPLEEIADDLKGKPKSLIFGEDEIENLFTLQYGRSYAFPALAMLYTTLDYHNQFHIDHIHPKSFFTNRKLKKEGINDIEFYLENYNSLANLQLLEGPINEEKSNTPFAQWLKTNFKETEKRDFMKKHYIPDVDLDIMNFKEFIVERKALMRKQFESSLKI